MGMRGPAPKPLELVKAQGNTAKKKLPRNAPRFKPKPPECPLWLDALAKKEWARLAPELHNLNLLTTADLAAFASYCSAYSQLQQAEKVLQKHGRIFETPNGYLMPRPEVAMSNQAMKQIKDFAVQFGFTPSARSRIDLKPQEEAGSEDLD